MVVEVLTCVNNLQSRCDMIEDAASILGCAACCSGIENTEYQSLQDDGLQEDLSYSEVFTAAVNDQKYSEEIDGSQVDSISLPARIAVNQGLPPASYAKRSRKKPAGSSEEENFMKGKVSHHSESTVSASQPSVTVSGMGSRISGQLPAEKGKIMTAKPRKGKDILIVSIPAEKNLLPRAQKQSISNEGIDAETAAFEWQQCVSLLKSYGIIENPDLYNTEALLHHVPHPGFTGDGLQSKVCKICGADEDFNNTVICDNCQETFHLSCCHPRMTSKYFKREDSWFCISCKKPKKRIGSKLIEGNSSQEGNSTKGSASHESKARLGCAHQADIPKWQKRADDDDAERRAPLNVAQADNWECFCVMEWDPLHADCATPQECSDEEVLKRMSFRMQTDTDGHEVVSRKSTLRPGKL